MNSKLNATLFARRIGIFWPDGKIRHMKRRVTQFNWKGRQYFWQVGNGLVSSSSFITKEALDDTSSSKEEVLIFNVGAILCEIPKFNQGKKFIRAKLLDLMDQLLC